MSVEDAVRVVLADLDRQARERRVEAARTDQPEPILEDALELEYVAEGIRSVYEGGGW